MTSVTRKRPITRFRVKVINAEEENGVDAQNGQDWTEAFDGS
jgi:hypothetical protein